MKHIEISGIHVRAVMGTVAFIALTTAILTGFTGPAATQEKLTSAQTQTLAQCLTGCKKGDAACQDACTKKAATPAYFSAAGSCIRACADALVVPGQKSESITSDLQMCVKACN